MTPPPRGKNLSNGMERERKKRRIQEQKKTAPRSRCQITGEKG